MNQIEDHIEQMKKIYDAIRNYIVNQSNEEEDFNVLSNFLNSQDIQKNQQIMKSFLHIISCISNHYHQYPSFFNKIEGILLLFKSDIQKHFSNFEIFSIFRKNKRVLLFLFTEKIIIPDENIAATITFDKYKKRLYPHFFLLEFKEFFDPQLKKDIKKAIIESSENTEDFLQKRLKGENHSPICKLIREDSVIEFITYVSKQNINLNSKINTSLFETNRFLINKRPLLIEYAAFYGSIQIFQFLLKNLDNFDPSIWRFAIHGNNPELIHILEDYKIEPSYKKCLKESIKCHHNEIGQYFVDQHFSYQSNEFKSLLLNFFKYYNFDFIPKNVVSNADSSSILLSQNSSFIQLFLKYSSFDVNRPKIHKIMFFINIV